MKTIKHTKDELILQPKQKQQSARSFVFNLDDVDALHTKPTPKRIVFRYGGFDYAASWRKFNKMQCIGDVALLPKKDFTKTRTVK